MQECGQNGGMSLSLWTPRIVKRHPKFFAVFFLCAVFLPTYIESLWSLLNPVQTLLREQQWEPTISWLYIITAPVGAYFLIAILINTRRSKHQLSFKSSLREALDVDQRLAELEKQIDPRKKSIRWQFYCIQLSYKLYELLFTAVGKLERKNAITAPQVKILLVKGRVFADAHEKARQHLLPYVQQKEQGTPSWEPVLESLAKEVELVSSLSGDILKALMDESETYRK